MTTSLENIDKQVAVAMESFGTLSKKTVTLSNFKNELEITINRYKSFISAFDKLNPKEKQKYADRIYSTKNASQAAKAGKACQIYADIVASIRSRNDARVAFTDIVKTAKGMKNILDNFYQNASEIFEKKNEINIQNAKLSHVSVMGMIEDAECYLDYALSLFNTTTYEIVSNNNVNELAPVAGYRYKFLDDYKNKFVDIYKKVSFGGHSTYLSAFKKLLQSKDNIYIGNPATGSNIPLLDTNKREILESGLHHGIWSLNPFRWLGEIYNIIRHDKYVKMQAERDDIAAHVALLQLALSEKDPNSEEYKKAVKVIDSYNQMIAELDRKINEYYNEDED